MTKQTAPFDQFWNTYPSRNGRKLERPATFKAFTAIAKKHWPLVIQCAKNFAASKDVKTGIGIKDPKRFLKNDFWREWMVPDKTESFDRNQFNPKIKPCLKQVNETPEQKAIKKKYTSSILTLGKAKIPQEVKRELINNLKKKMEKELGSMT